MMTASPDGPELRVTGDHISLHWPDGGAGRYPGIWLRDNVPGPQFRHADNDQRLFDVGDLPERVSIRTARHVPADGMIEVVFDGEDDLRARYPLAFLRRYANGHDGAGNGGGGAAGPGDLWSGAAEQDIRRHDYRAVRDHPASLRAWLGDIARLGIAVLADVPRRKASVIRVAELFGHVRETNYGRLFDVRTTARPVNMAYSDAGLPPHTDNPYRDPVPGLQLLHCLKAAAVGGGDHCG